MTAMSAITAIYPSAPSFPPRFKGFFRASAVRFSDSPIPRFPDYPITRSPD
jgi:hypothetical protein